MRTTAAVAAIFVALTWGAGAVACELCLGAAKERITIADQLGYATNVVIATSGPAGELRTVAIVKGDEPLPEGIAVDSLGPAILLVGGAEQGGWTSLGSVEQGDADWLRLVASGSRDWDERLRLALPRLGGGGHTLGEEIAWGEIAGAPYARLATVRGRIDPSEVARWLDDPDFAPHRAQVVHLCGYVGGPGCATRIDAEVEAAAASHDSRLLGPLLLAELELRGPAELAWIEDTYFAGRTRSMAEIEGALFALRVQGQADRTVPRALIVAAFRRLVAAHPQLAGSVAPTLEDWSAWDAAVDFKALLAAGTLADPASEYAVQLYVQAAANAAVKVTQ